MDSRPIQSETCHQVHTAICELPQGTPRAGAVDMDQLESLFAVVENASLRRLTAQRAADIRLVEHRRAHNISIELSGIRKPFPAIKVGM